MAFDVEWSESDPEQTEEASLGAGRIRDDRYAVRERAAVQHKAYADETGHDDVWEHTPGECTVLFAGEKADFPTPATTTKGCIAIATDENNKPYYWNGSAWTEVGIVLTGGQTQTITGAKTFATACTFNEAPTMKKGLVVEQNTDIGDYNLRAKTLESDVATGTAPLTVASATKVSNLNADKIDGKDGDAQFGDWASKDNNTVYQAESDGSVCAYSATSPGTELQGFTDGNNPPTTKRKSCFGAGTGSINDITMPVRKGDYWKVVNAATVYWLPIGA